MRASMEQRLEKSRAQDRYFFHGQLILSITSGTVRLHGVLKEGIEPGAAEVMGKGLGAHELLESIPGRMAIRTYH